MQLPAEAVKEFQGLWSDATGESLEFEDAEVQASALIRVLYASLKPTESQNK